MGLWSQSSNHPGQIQVSCRSPRRRRSPRSPSHRTSRSRRTCSTPCTKRLIPKNEVGKKMEKRHWTIELHRIWCEHGMFITCSFKRCMLVWIRVAFDVSRGPYPKVILKEIGKPILESWNPGWNTVHCIPHEIPKHDVSIKRLQDYRFWFPGRFKQCCFLSKSQCNAVEDIKH